jgi:hypothetical protein
LADPMAIDSQSRFDQRHLARSPRARPIVFLGLLGTFLAVGWVVWNASQNERFDGRGGLSPYLKISRDLPPSGRFPGDPYVGSKVCAECHPGEFAVFTKSAHARTFRPAAERIVTDQLAGVSIADPELPDVRWTFEKKDGQFLIDRQEAGKIEQFVVDYALGSGHHATTFVTVLDLNDPKILEHRLTYYTRERELGKTPGQSVENQYRKKTPWGCELSSRESRKCFRCHATQLSADNESVIDPAMMIPNVACERCHGPARAHVAAARRGAGEAELTMPMGLGRWTAETQLELCGKCHRHPTRVPPEMLSADDPALARFQPIGLSQSKCFTGSNGAFTCVSCHDPHARSTSDRAFYEQVCLNCHRSSQAGPAEVSEHEAPPPAAGSVCPVSPAGACVSCHMSKVDSGQHVLFTDHWIRVRRPAERPQELGGR